MRKLWLLWLLGVSCVLSLVPPAQAEPRPYLDLDFELPECSTFWPTQGFTSFPYEHRVDTTQAQSGRQSLRVDHLSPLPVNPAAGPYLFKFLDPAEVAGKRVRYSGYIRTEGMASGYAGLFLYAVGPQGFVLQDLAQPATGTTPWTRYELEADVPPGVTSAMIAVERTGDGTVWFDNLAVAVDGRPLQQGPPSSQSGPPPGHANWLSRRVVPLDAVTAGNGFADLQALETAIGGARIVALGEGTHGTREFFQMKHRLFELLVEEMGFTHLAFEGGMAEWQKINEYVLTGVGDPAQLLRAQLTWPWNTQEVLDLILWMRQYNAAGKGPVQLAGFDMPFSRT
ncbi:MAG TPA: erythromycin esterase family protein, partial [Thermoanaerobaculia bacterium]|nr:erythromycin esterase family protein [Thermoanaerobaculia bacterium]